MLSLLCLQFMAVLSFNRQVLKRIFLEVAVTWHRIFLDGHRMRGYIMIQKMLQTCRRLFLVKMLGPAAGSWRNLSVMTAYCLETIVVRSQREIPSGDSFYTSSSLFNAGPDADSFWRLCPLTSHGSERDSCKGHGIKDISSLRRKRFYRRGAHDQFKHQAGFQEELIVRSSFYLSLTVTWPPRKNWERPEEGSGL